MSSKLQTAFQELETNRKNLFDELRIYPDELLNKKPSPEAWSVVQVIEHLIASEGASLKYLQKKTLDTSRAKKAGLMGEGKLLLTKSLFYVPIKFKAPKFLVPTENLVQLNNLEGDWKKIRSETYHLLKALPEKDLDKELWKHAIAGKMNIHQMLSFFNIHFNRHREQIKRTISAVN